MTDTIAILKPDKKNRRKHNERNIGMIVNSLQQVGASRSIVIDEDNNILAGNGTVEAAQLAGIERMRIVDADGEEIIAVRRTGLTDEQKRRLALYDNRTAEIAEWNLEQILEDVNEGLTFDGMFGKAELDELLRDLKPAGDGDAEPKMDRAAELNEKWQVKTGDLWQIGSHKLVCGDCTDKLVVERVMGGEKATMVFTDPPYGVSIGEKNRLLNSFQKSGRNLTDIEADSMAPDDLGKMLLNAFKLVKEQLTDDASVFVCSPSLGLMMMMMMMMNAGLEVKHVLNWVKNAPTFSLGRLDYDYQHEPILFTWNKTHKRYKRGFKTTIWNVNKPRHSPDHPTIKPVELPTNALLNHSDESDVCYDPFLGSGTTMVACQNLHRKCRAIEISPNYCAVILERMQDAFGIVPELMEVQ